MDAAALDTSQPSRFWALVEEKGLQADFTQQREPVRADVQGSVKLVSLTRVQNNTTRSIRVTTP